MRLPDGRHILLHAEFRLNDHREDAPHFIIQAKKIGSQSLDSSLSIHYFDF